MSDSGLPDVLDITEACQLCGCSLNGSLLDITQLLHNDPTVLLLLQHARWLTMKVMARQIWAACVCKKSEKHTEILLVTAELFVKGMENVFITSSGCFNTP